MKQYNVYGVGNALVDIEFELTVPELEGLGVAKGVMTLMDEKQQKKIIDQLGGLETNRGSGGSAANTIIAVSQFGGKSYYSCRVGNDKLGQFYIEDLSRAGVSTNIDKQRVKPGITGKCLVFVTPDADRTMNTFLGASADVAPEDISVSAIEQSEYLYLEGYLVSGESTKAAALYAIEHAHKAGTKVALSLSDPNIVRFFRSQIDQLIGDGVDLLFANEDEAKYLAVANSIESAVEHVKGLAKHFVITRGSKGALVYDGAQLIEIAPVKVKAVDTVGAGDMFAGAFLYGITNGMSYEQAGKLAATAAAKLVASFGPRLKAQQAMALLEQFIAR
ncbi:MAG: adenosine kinase [Gammaproteobacteria bacterium]|nr:adenosine kinase [Gammaproteobacteria bacterium]